MMAHVLMIVFACVAINHLGLVATIEGIVKRRLPVVNCPKCLSCWMVLAYQLLVGSAIIPAIALALLSAWAATWLHLLMAIIDTFYNRIYDTIFTATDLGATHAPSDNARVPVLPQKQQSRTKGNSKTH